MIERLRYFLRKRSDVETRRLAREAADWLKDESLNVGLAAFRQSLIERWLSSTTVEDREKCWYEIHRVNGFVKTLRVIVESDKIKLDAERRQEKRAASAGPQQA